MQQQLDQAPVGTCNHRLRHCPRLAEKRGEYTPEVMLTGSTNVSQDKVDTAAFERALFAHHVPRPTVVGTFTWVVKPASGTVNGVIYTDGSRLDGPSALLAGNDWAYVALE